MNHVRDQELRSALRSFVERDNAIAYLAVTVDFCVYLLATGFAVWVEPIWLKIVLSTIAGTMTATLFVLGHDAAHGSLVRDPRQNSLLGHLLFLPALHNYTLWRVQHNRLHHQAPNVKGQNSWSPMSLSEFRALPRWRQWVERIYRGGGFGLYYLAERWWKDKFFPFDQKDAKIRTKALRDFALLVVWLTVLGSAVVVLGIYADSPWWFSLLWGVALPYVFWNFSIGLTVYLHHTHHAVPWFRSQAEAAQHAGQEELTINVEYPRWYGLLSHEIMEHTAHHINPLIPFYRLHAAQKHLNAVLGDDAVVERIGFRYVFHLIQRCKLYDYDRREWTDFSGRSTARHSTALPLPERPGGYRAPGP